MTSFGSLNTGVTGLLAAQRALAATAQNVVNASTPGYSRQKVEQSSVGLTSSAVFHTGTNNPPTGVQIDGVVRIRDSFLEATRAAAGGRLESLQARQSTLAGVESLVSEPGEVGLQSGLDAFYSAWHELSTNPTEAAAGSAVIQKAIAVTDQLHTLGNGIATQWQETHNQLADVVAKANQAASDLAEINQRVGEGVRAGTAVNELMDKRDALVRTLSELVGGYAVPGQDGQVAVAVNGITIVHGMTAEKLTLTGAGSLDDAVTDPPTIRWGTVEVSVESGAAAGHLATLRTDLPDLSTKLDGVAQGLSDSVNAVHTGGFTLGGSAGGTFFSGVTARTITLTSTSTDDLAISTAPGVVDGANAMKLGDLAKDQNSSTVLGGGPSPLQQWRSLTTGLGGQVDNLNSAIKVQSSVVTTADDAVESNAGVSLDEEMSNLLAFQRAYQASARVITTVDEMMDTLINKTGLVGR